MIAFPSLHPIESSTLGPQSALFAAELAERISLALRAIAEGMHVGSVTLGQAVAELRTLRDEADTLSTRVGDLYDDGAHQWDTELAACGWYPPHARRPRA